MSSANLEVVILAAGQGTRMRSALPKVLHQLAGKALVHHVIDTARILEAGRIHTVIGHGADAVRERLGGLPVHWVTQAEQLGTGHAVAQALPALDDGSVVLVLYGDVPLVRPETLARLLAVVGEGRIGLLTVELDDPNGYGRVLRDARGRITAIVEQRDASPAQLAIREVNTGIFALRTHHLKEWLPRLGADNAQGEYYLTDIVALAVRQHIDVVGLRPDAIWEVQGINNRQQLAALERQYQRNVAERLLADGVTLADPARIDVRGRIRAGTDTFIDVNCVFEGDVEIGSGVRIESNCVIRDARIADHAEILANSYIENSVVGANAVVGPFARLRPGTELAQKAKIGNFVETKKTYLGEGSKANHLTYLGDCTVGAGANVGAGTITCNYDGVNKFKTEIGAGAFIGSNSSLVAPVNVGANATVGAGSVITGDVPDASLAVGRGKQRNIEGWQRPTKKS